MAARARRFEFRLIPTIVATVILVVLVGLGTWQVDRLVWKQALLERIDSQLAAAPVALPDGPLDPAEWDYRRVRVSGEYLHERTQRVLNRTRDGQVGAHLVTPLVRDDGGAGSVVLVNRGWVPAAATAGAGAPIAEPEGRVTVTGILVDPEEGGFLAGPAAAEGNEWLSVELDAMAQAVGYPGALDLMLYADDVGQGLPVGGQARIDIPNNHLQYVVTWYGLAVVLVVIFLIYSRRRRRPEPGSRGGKP